MSCQITVGHRFPARGGGEDVQGTVRHDGQGKNAADGGSQGVKGGL